MRLFKKFIFIAFLAIILSLIAGSLLPPELSHRYFYGALWFKSLWFFIASGVIAAVLDSIRRKEFGFSTIYVGFLLVLLGGFLTSLWGEEGFIELKEGQTQNGFWIEDNLFRPLDFSITLKDFSVEFYPEQREGMRFVKRYKSLATITKEGNVLREGSIEVNRPLSFGGYAFYQYGYDADLPNQTILQVVNDPALPLVYLGYLLVLTGMLFSFKRVLVK